MAARAELLTGAGVHQQYHGQLPLFDESLDKRMTHAGRDVPVNVANIVAGLIFADLFESNAGAFEDAVIFATEEIFDGPAGSKLQKANLTQDIARKHKPILTWIHDAI